MYDEHHNLFTNTITSAYNATVTSSTIYLHLFVTYKKNCHFLFFRKCEPKCIDRNIFIGVMKESRCRSEYEPIERRNSASFKISPRENKIKNSAESRGIEAEDSKKFTSKKKDARGNIKIVFTLTKKSPGSFIEENVTPSLLYRAWIIFSSEARGGRGQDRPGNTKCVSRIFHRAREPNTDDRSRRDFYWEFPRANGHHSNSHLRRRRNDRNSSKTRDLLTVTSTRNLYKISAILYLKKEREHWRLFDTYWIEVFANENLCVCATRAMTMKNLWTDIAS